MFLTVMQRIVKWTIYPVWCCRSVK